MTSALVIVYAFWKGEASYDECARSCATTLLLLEFQRTRWGSDVDTPARSLRELAVASGIAIRPYAEQLLPSADASFVSAVCGDAVVAELSGMNEGPSASLEAYEITPEWSPDLPSDDLLDGPTPGGFWEQVPFYADIMDYKPA